MALTKGQNAPDFTKTLDNGETIQLSKLNADHIILYFYPKDNTPGCTAQACGIRDNLEELENYGAKIFGISKDTGSSHKKFREKHSLNFPLIVDPDAELARSYGVLKQKSMFGKQYEGIERTTFIINRHMQIVEVLEKVNPANHAQKLIESLEAMKQTVHT
jgi:peroxiredoxin Q/BCP